ncbi:hypothetical protein LRP52_40445 [Photobacterium sp. ZSDE20]|nr:hypothetical protein [Photobacterium sp. ZSDE20]
MLIIALEAFLELLNDDSCEAVNSNTPFTVITVDTLNDTAAMTMFSRYCSNKLKAYCQSVGINLDFHLVQPPLDKEYASLFFSAYKLVALPQLNSDCTAILKIDNINQTLRSLKAKYGADSFVICTGSTADESQNRKHSMAKHGTLTQSAEGLISNASGEYQSYAPIRDFLVEEVFEMLSMCGISPLNCRHDQPLIPFYLDSNALLFSIYGRSATDVCEVSHVSKSAKGCGGKGNRQGCNLCLKVGKEDKAATRHNQSPRWNFQRDITALRDYLYTVGSDLSHRTLHPKSICPVTNSVIYQPNVLKSRTLEKILWWAAQITYDDQKRASDFAELVRAGNVHTHAGVKDIEADSTLDQQAKQQYLEMYIDGCQQPLMNIFNIEHAIYLSMQYSYLGVKSLPYRPLAIWNAVFNKGKRIPFPSVDTNTAIISDLPDAIAFQLAPVGTDINDLYRQPFRSWDLIDADMQPQCLSTQYVVNTQSIKATWDHGNITTTVKGKQFTLGPGAYRHLQRSLEEMATERGENFTVNVTLNDRSEAGFALPRTTARTARKVDTHRHKSVRSIIRTKRNGRSIINRGRTSLKLNPASDIASQAMALTDERSFWLPSFDREVRPTVNTAIELPCDADTADFHVNREAISEFIKTELPEMIRIHDEFALMLRHQKRREAGKMTLRQYINTEPVWHLLRSSILFVPEGKKKSTLRLMRRTELYAELDLYNKPDSFEANADHPKCLSMHQYRKMKAKVLIDIRNRRNASRAEARQLKTVNRSRLVADWVTQHIKELHCHRMNYSVQHIDTALLLAAGVTGFDHINIKQQGLVYLDWHDEIGSSLNSIESFLSTFLPKPDIKTLNQVPNVMIKLEKKLNDLNKQFNTTVNSKLAMWRELYESLPTYAELAGTVLNEEQQIHYMAEANDFSGNLIIENNHYLGWQVYQNLSGTAYTVLTHRVMPWHRTQQHRQAFEAELARLQTTSEIKTASTALNRSSGSSKMQALMSLTRAA